AIRGAHAKARRAGRLRALGGLAHLVERHQIVRLDGRIETNALRTVRAVLGTRAGLDRQQRRALHRVRIEMLPVHPLRRVKQIEERQLEKCLDLVERPICSRPSADRKTVDADFVVGRGHSVVAPCAAVEEARSIRTAYRSVNLRKLLQRLAAVALPERCPACSGPTTKGFCSGCRAELPRIEDPCVVCGLPKPVAHCPRQRGGWHVVAVRAPFRYAPPLDAYLHKLKFGRVRALGRALALAAAPSLAAGVDAPRESDPLLVPVPLSRERLLERGFDQAVEIARALARELALPADTAVAMRRKPIAPQSL